ncbi:unnamed protein product [Penicillium nalgiovense]|uniref:Uncharacterized protein n=1 Tax=Penicillium nalgiovense TaxID=60175 RepID=A0A9W4MSK1_PENNA|nr:unnamed protein product [Penicillium nalgiovense]CAG8016459.1 unnamed protein product [Penicillium nalgiovense]CAG8031262.1 unnamed protein product [Penicillium nalgiovense]CAG8038104.1 unnamed protein product [Penicillium nalgiovense]CAG8050452.1 unnamed protein product [Penicillium nalgiovense]
MHIKLIPTLGLMLPLFTAVAQANVEKTIFLAPAPATVPSEEPDLDDLGLERLSPQRPVVRTRLNASFPTTEAPDGTDSWFFLENLNPGQRYEVRVCWLATQPTTFTLTTYPLSKTIEDKNLLSSLSMYTSDRLAALDPKLQANSIPRRGNPRSSKDPLDPAPTSDSVLFLHVYAAADYFSTNQALMQNVPPVAVDLILDPFVFNVFPRSLVPTAGWIVLVAALALVIGRWAVNEVGRAVGDARRQSVLEEMKKK